MKSPFFPRVTLVLMAVSLFLALGSTIPLFGQSQTDRQQQLEKAVSKMWVEGFDAQTRTILSEIGAADHEVVGNKALFYLACGEVMSGNRAEAMKVLERLEGRLPKGELPGQIARFKSMLAPVPVASETLNVDVKDMPVPEVIRLIARMVGRAVIIDAQVLWTRSQPVTLYLPKVKFDEVLKILSDLADLETKMMGDILVVTPKNREMSSESQADGTVSFDFKDVDIRDALRVIAKTGKFNITLHRSVKGLMSLRLEKAQPLEALRLITKANDLYVEKDGENYLVMNKKDVQNVTGRADRIMVTPVHLTPADALSLLAHEKFDTVSYWEDKKGIILTGNPAMIEKARDFLLSQDKPQKPLQLSLKIWEIQGGKSVSPEEFLKLDDSQKNGIAKLLSSPRIITIPGRSASIKVENKGSEDQKAETGISISMFPLMVGDNMARVDMKGQITTIDTREKVKQSREWASVFVIKLGAPFVYQVQGGTTPTLLEIKVDHPE